MNLRAFHMNDHIKQGAILEMQEHLDQDAVVHGQYWQHGKGCFIGCMTHAHMDDIQREMDEWHRVFEELYGVPRQLAYLLDRLFEGLPNEEAQTFTLAVWHAIPVGADLSLVVPHFIVWLLTDNEHGVLRFAGEQGRAAIQAVANLYQRKIAGGTVSDEEWIAARKSADAAYAAADAAYAAAYAAYAAYVAYAAADAADAAYAAADAAYAAYAAADAADAAYAAYAAYAAAADGRKHYQIMAEHLLALLAEAPIPEEASA